MKPESKTTSVALSPEVLKKKVCSKCGCEKPITEFHLDWRNKLNPIPKSKCISCERAYAKQYTINNPEKIKLKAKNWAKENRARKTKTDYQWRDRNKTKVRESKNKYELNKKKTDCLYRLKANLRTMINNTLRRKGFNKNQKTCDIIGCSFEDFKTHIEIQFEPWMNWNNHGLYNGELNHGWDIDHIKPISSGISESELIQLNHYSNLRPLCSKVNRDIKKGEIISM